jgi:Fe-S oxidoreductase
MSKNLNKLIPPCHIYIRDNVLKSGNMVGVDEDKAGWAARLDLPQRAEYTFFAGCGYQFMKYAEGMLGAARSLEKVGIGMNKIVGLDRAFKKVGVNLTNLSAKVVSASLEDRYTKTLLSAVSVLRKLGLDLGYLHQDEPCCGSPLYYGGFVPEFTQTARKNFEIFQSCGVGKLIGLVPACTAALKGLYPRYVEGYDLEVWHFYEIVAREIKRTGKRMKLAEKMIVTYHDPCQLSRHMEIVREPREIMGLIEGLELLEPGTERCGEWSTCCGGGELEASHPQLSHRLGQKRAGELLATGAPVVVTSCPACLKQLSRAVAPEVPRPRVMDLIELIDQAL